MDFTAGLGFKIGQLEETLTTDVRGLWFEVHAENYMVDGGPRLAALVALRNRYPLSLHGVGLSLASVEPPDANHLARLKQLADRISPALVSDHLAWQRWAGMHHADFLPFPRTAEALGYVVDNIDRVQNALGRALLIENPSQYIELPGNEMPEVDFLAEMARQTGCGLLVDVNNIFVSASNLGFRPEPRIDAIPADMIGEIHLAGHTPDADPSIPLIIDSHDMPIADGVWALYRRLVDRVGPRPTIIERDDRIPPFEALLVERNAADRIMTGALKRREAAYV
jgi:uncharacterized protein (UPF0276 family)